MADVNAFGIFVTVVSLVLAWVLWLTHLKKKTRQMELYYEMCHRPHPTWMHWMWSAQDRKKDDRPCPCHQSVLHGFDFVVSF